MRTLPNFEMADAASQVGVFFVFQQAAALNYQWSNDWVATQDADEDLSRSTGDPATAPQVTQVSQTTQINQLNSNSILLSFGLGLDNYWEMYQNIDLIANADRVWAPLCKAEKDKFAAGDNVRNSVKTPLHRPVRLTKGSLS